MSNSQEPRSGFVDAGGLRLHYLDWGGPERQPMLLLHGLQDCARLWTDFAEAMHHRYHVVALDHRGHGDSPWASPDSYRLTSYVRELSEVIQALDLRDVILMGHSAGGKNAFVYAADSPQRLSKLLIVDMDPDRHNPGSVAMMDRYRGESDDYPDLDAVVERLRSREPDADEALLRRHAGHMTRPQDGGGLTWRRDRNVVTHYDRPDAWAYLPRITTPTLILRGAQSTLLTAPVAQRMRDEIPDCRLVELEGGGHWCHDEQPQAFQRAVEAFLGEAVG
jgi:pimeloyl-ACP methyl ester carboxylesterase